MKVLKTLRQAVSPKKDKVARKLHFELCLAKAELKCINVEAVKEHNLAKPKV